MNPFIPLAGAHILVAGTWPFLPPRSIYRPIVVALVVFCCAVSFNSTDKNAWWGSYLAEYVCGFALHANYFLCLQKLADSSDDPPLQKVKAHFVMLFSSRFQIPTKELPPFSAGESEYVPSRGTFLLARIWTFAWTTSAYATVHNYPLNLWTDDFESPKHQLLRRLPDVSAREWVILFYISIYTWFMPYCLFTAAHSLASVFAVAFGDAPINWRPLFGDIREAYTVQRFFGVFWHKLMRKAFTGHASLVVHDVLGMPRRAPQSRAAIIFVSFLVSGALHSLVSPQSLKCASPPIMLYYCQFGGVVVLEHVVQRVLERYSATLNKTGLAGNQSNWQLLGYVWVICFHLWTSLKSTAPLVLCDRGHMAKVAT